MHRILDILENNADLTPAEIAVMINSTEQEVAEAITKYKEEGIILGKKTVINWQKTDKEFVTAIIELRVSPQFGKGFDEIAERLYQYDNVKDVFLMSGAYDLSLTVEGRTLTDVALFVSEKLAPMEQVISTATHSVLRRYKHDGILMTKQKKDDRRVMIL